MDGIFNLESKCSRKPSGKLTAPGKFTSVASLEGAAMVENELDRIVKTGYSDADIARAIGQDILRVLREVWV